VHYLAGIDAFLIINDIGVKDVNVMWVENEEDIKSLVVTFHVSVGT